MVYDVFGYNGIVIDDDCVLYLFVYLGWEFFGFDCMFLESVCVLWERDEWVVVVVLQCGFFVGELQVIGVEVLILLMFVFWKFFLYLCNWFCFVRDVVCGIVVFVVIVCCLCFWVFYVSMIVLLFWLLIGWLSWVLMVMYVYEVEVLVFWLVNFVLYVLYFVLYCIIVNSCFMLQIVGVVFFVFG